MREPAHRLIKRSMTVAGVCAAAGGLVLLPDIVAGRAVQTLPLILAAALCLTAVGLLLRSWRAANALGHGLEATRTAVLNLVADRDADLPGALPGGEVPEIAAMLGSLRLYHEDRMRERHGPDRRLVAVLSSLASGVVVITESGQVSLLNNAARELLGAERARVGTSVYAALDRTSVVAATRRAEKAGRPVEALIERLDDVSLQGQVTALPDGEGAVFIFPPVELVRHRPGVEFDLQLHDVPPARDELTLDLDLADLPVVVVDTETTGLSVTEDRVVSVGAVCAHGPRLFRSRMIDALVHPGGPIPPQSTAIHGITDEMVAGAPSFPEAWADFQRLARNRVVVGHNVCFDITILREECRRHGQPWEDLVFIDTLRLASLLNPTLSGHDLDSLARLYQLDIHGRHTALGDALVTAELFHRIVLRLQQQGIATLRDLLEFHCTRAVDVIARQKEQGWITHQPAGLGTPEA